MTFAEFEKQNGDCDECPIRKAELCNFAMCREFSCDPPCSFADPDQDMDEWIIAKNKQISQIEAYRDKLYKKEQEKIQKAKERAETIRAMKSYCNAELERVAFWKKVLKEAESSIQTAELRVEAVNLTNEMFRNEERYKVKPYLYKIFEEAKQKLEIAQEQYRIKRKEFYKIQKGQKNV